MILVLAISIFPWEVLELCPNKDGHHDPEEMHHGNCAEGMMDDHGADESSESIFLSDHILQGTSCTTMAPAVDSYNAGQSLLKPSLQQVAVLAVVFELLNKPSDYQQPNYPVPEFLNKSSPPTNINPLRGPPIQS